MERALPLPPPHPRAKEAARDARRPRRPVDDSDATLGLGLPPAPAPAPRALPRGASVTAAELQAMIRELEDSRKAERLETPFEHAVWNAVLSGCIESGMMDLPLHEDAARRCKRMIASEGIVGVRLAAAVAIATAARNVGGKADTGLLARWAGVSGHAVERMVERAMC